MKKILSSLFFGLVGGLVAFVSIQHFTPQPADSENTKETPPAQFINMPSVATDGGEIVNFEYAADQAVHAVVHVWTERVGQSYDPWAYFFGRPAQPRVSLSSGSGVIVSGDGFVVTNNHVIEGAQNIRVKLNNGETKEAELIGRDPSTDLALLKLEGNEKYPYLPYGDSDQIKVGQWVLAVGNPFNLSSTVTAGIVSAKARNINLLEQGADRQFPLESFIQTDAAVNPGNSGGALVGVNGELLGINTAIASNTGSYAGYSFAVPVNLVKKVVSDLYEFGTVQRAFIGVNIRDLNQELVDDLELTDYDGVYVADVTENGAAKDAGINAGDVIRTVNDVPVKNVTELQEQIGKYRPGDKVNLTLLRDGKQLAKRVTLRNQAGGTELKAVPLPGDIKRVLGADLRAASPEELNKLKLKNGVVVESLEGSMLGRSGMKTGFMITKIDKKPVLSPNDVQEALSSKKSGALIEGYYPNGYKAYYGFGM